MKHKITRGVPFSTNGDSTTCNRVLQTRFRNPDPSRCLPSALTSLYPTGCKGGFTAFRHLLSRRRTFFWEQEELLSYLAIQSVNIFLQYGINSHGDLDRVISLGYGFISTDYQLLPPATGHDIVKDIQDVFSFITGNAVVDKNMRIKGDPDRLAVAGSSAGGLCAYLAALHASPRPKAVLSIYGMGGNFFVRDPDLPHCDSAHNFL